MEEINELMKEWIDNATYEELLSRWRFASDGDLIFQGEAGEYYAEVMKKKGEEIGDDARVKASKSVGW